MAVQLRLCHVIVGAEHNAAKLLDLIRQGTC